jgi:hypothetical protein
LCFVDFDAVHEELLVPATRDAALEPLRADQELVGVLIHKPMFERLILADYAVADLKDDVRARRSRDRPTPTRRQQISRSDLSLACGR